MVAKEPPPSRRFRTVEAENHEAVEGVVNAISDFMVCKKEHAVAWGCQSVSEDVKCPDQFCLLATNAVIRDNAVWTRAV